MTPANTVPHHTQSAIECIVKTGRRIVTPIVRPIVRLSRHGCHLGEHEYRFTAPLNQSRKARIYGKNDLRDLHLIISQ